jgi:hypothetical protein
MEQSGAKAVARRWHENGLQLAVVKTDGDVNMPQVLKEVLEDELGYTKFVYGESLSDSLKYYYQIKDWNHGSKSVRDLAMSVKNCEVTDRLHAAPVACGGCAKWVDPKTGKCTGMWTSCKGITKEWERKHARRAITTHFRTCEAKAVENNLTYKEFWSGYFWDYAGELFQRCLDCSFDKHSNCDPDICPCHPNTTKKQTRNVPRVTCRPQEESFRDRVGMKFSLPVMQRLLTTKDLPGVHHTVKNDGTNPCQAGRNQVCEFCPKDQHSSTTQCVTGGCLASAHMAEVALHTQALLVHPQKLAVATSDSHGDGDGSGIGDGGGNSDETPASKKKRRAKRDHPPVKLLAIDSMLLNIEAHAGLKSGQLALRQPARRTFEKDVERRADRSVTRNEDTYRSKVAVDVANKRFPPLSINPALAYKGDNAGEAPVLPAESRRKNKNVARTSDAKTGGTGKGSRQGKLTRAENKKIIDEMLANAHVEYKARPPFEHDTTMKSRQLKADGMYQMRCRVQEWLKILKASHTSKTTDPMLTRALKLLLLPPLRLWLLLAQRAIFHI